MLNNDPKYYKHIALVVTSSLVVCTMAILTLNAQVVSAFMNRLFGERQAFIFQLWFWAALGASLASYKFLADDKDLNERESLKPTPDPQVVRYPCRLDVVLYALRIVFSGVQGVVAAIVVFAGLGYFEVPSSVITEKHRFFLEVLCFVVGMNQRLFLNFLHGLTRRLLQARDAEGPKAES